MNKKLNVLIGIGVVTAIALVFIAYQEYQGSQKPAAKLNADHPALQNPDVAGKQVVERIELSTKKPAFNFRLTDMDRTLTQLDDFKGKLVLVGFIYTSCPDVCGLLTQHFRYIQREFKDEIDKDLVLVLITTDPERDTPERTKAYTDGFQGRWHFLTGSESQLSEVWDEYKVFVQAKKSVDLVYHSYMVALIDRDANIRYRYIGLVDPEEVIVKDIKKLLKEQEV
ncbi:MAG: SCO family protein [Fidelibacterota bacterium]